MAPSGLLNGAPILGPIVKPLYIFDIDGTIANVRHRLHILDEVQGDEKWDQFYALCDQDSPKHNVIALMSELRKTSDIWFFTGRPERLRIKTVQWLIHNAFIPATQLETELMMRPDDDHRPDDELKQDWYKGMLDVDRDRLVGVFEDRDRVVAMWRREGVQCYQVADGNF